MDRYGTVYGSMLYHDAPNDFFFRPSPSWLLPGRNKVSCPLNELCRSCIASSLGVSKKSMDPYTVQISVHIRWRHCKGKKHENKQKTQKQNKQTKHQTQTKQKPASSQWTSSSMRISSSLCANGQALRALNQTPKLKTSQSQGAREGCKKTSTRCGNPGSPQPGSRRSQRDAHRAQQAPLSQDRC